MDIHNNKNNMSIMFQGFLIGTIVSVLYCKFNNVRTDINDMGVSPALICVCVGTFTGIFLGYHC
ncbi:putative orfan [Tupanvirus soda lake]|uniref:Orfan n=1 Tax=Tupanvirus deep ocean TaxID=2126984 RepID=A0AC59HC19_9VIRU|nr:putative orfan [Tupanvirus soda lake]AUL78423.2 putative orfan [Tupanvirus soda lake]